MIKSRIKEQMEAKGVSVLALSLDTGLATETITRARDDRILYCKLQTLEVIANALGLKIKDLFSENPL